jgi:hypothetical protein
MSATISLRINASRTNSTLEKACTWGATPDGGMNRVALNADDKKARDWFVEVTKNLGCTHKIVCNLLNGYRLLLIR